MPVHDVQAHARQALPADQETQEEQEGPEPAADPHLTAQEAEAAADPALDPAPQPDPAADQAPDPEPQSELAANPARDPEPQPEVQYAWYCNRCGLGFQDGDKKVRDEAQGGRRGVRQRTPLFRCGKCNSLRTQMKNDNEFGNSWESVMALSAENAQKYFREARALTPAERQDFIAQHSVTNYESKEAKRRKRSEPQPLSVWEQRGYPIDKIQQNTKPEDIVEHDVLGKMYRIHLEVEDDIESNGWKADQRYQDRAEAASANTAASTSTPQPTQQDRSNALVQKSKTTISICAHKLCKQIQTFI